jgi:hypothetical protein
VLHGVRQGFARNSGEGRFDSLFDASGVARYHKAQRSFEMPAQAIYDVLQGWYEPS